MNRNNLISYIFFLILAIILGLAGFFISRNQGYINEVAFETKDKVFNEGKEIIEGSEKILEENLDSLSGCGNGVCENIACMAIGCPEAENEVNCPEDCSGDAKGMTEMANPASVKCLQDGADLEIRRNNEGGEIGYCIFSDGKECEEWSYFRGECNQE